MPTWTPVVNFSKDIGSFKTSIVRYHHSMEPTKEETRRRRRRISVDSAPGSPVENTGAHTSSDTIDRGSSADPDAVLTPSDPLAPLTQVTVNHSSLTTTPSLVEATASSSDARGRHTGKRRASGEMIHREEESKSMQSATPRAQDDEIRRPDIPERAVVSPLAHASSSHTPTDAQGHEPPHTQAVAAEHTPTLRVSTRRTTTTTRWSPSMPGSREHASRSVAQRASKTASQRSRGSTISPVTPPARPISNATQNINFDMLQPHFERPLQQAADSFGVCTTLLKKICRRNGISNWPYRKICGLRKSIASMAKQVNYFDGDQKRAYADQLEKLEHELQAYFRTGNEPTEEFLRTLNAEAAVATSEQQQNQQDAHTTAIDNEDEEKEAQVVPTWTVRPSMAPPHYSGVQVTQELQTTPRHLPAAVVSVDAWAGIHVRPRGLPMQAFPTIATHHRALPSIASILQRQSYSSPSRAASTQDPHHEEGQQQQMQWRYFPPTNDDAV